MNLLSNNNISFESIIEVNKVLVLAGGMPLRDIDGREEEIIEWLWDSNAITADQIDKALVAYFEPEPFEHKEYYTGM